MTTKSKIYFLFINEDYIKDTIEFEKFIKNWYPNKNFSILYLNFENNNFACPQNTNIVKINLNYEETKLCVRQYYQRYLIHNVIKLEKLIFLNRFL